MPKKNTEKIAAEILIKTGSILLSPESPFVYSSGIYSPIWIDGRRIASCPEEREIIIDMLIEQIDARVGRKNIDIIAGTSSSGISLATFVSRRLEMPMIYVRSKPKEHGKGRQIEGAFEKGKSVVLLTDIISTQKDVVLAVEALKEAGMKIAACFATYDNCLKGINGFLEKNKIPLYALTNLRTLLSVGENLHFIPPKEKEIVTAWLKAPEKWLVNRAEYIRKSEEEREKRASEILLKIGAVTLSPSKPYRYTSGVLSPIYTDNRLLMSHPGEWKEIVDAFADVVINRIGRQNITVIAGTDSAGISHAAYLASLLHLPMAYIKSEETPYGTRRKIEGIIKAGDRVVIVEDLISTGKSSISAAKTAREAGAIVDYCLAIFDYGLVESKKAFSEAKCTLLAVTNVNALVEVAHEKKVISEREKRMVLDWQKEPMGWGKKMGFE